MSLQEDRRQISLVISAELLSKAEEAAKARCISRADYVRQALVEATKRDETLVAEAATIYQAPEATRPLTPRQAEAAFLEELNKRYG